MKTNNTPTLSPTDTVSDCCNSPIEIEQNSSGGWYTCTKCGKEGVGVTNPHTETVSDLQRITRFMPAYDKRNVDPKKNYGIGSVRVFMILKGDKGAVHFIFSTGMYLPKTHKEWLPKFGYNDEPYMGFDVGYHSPKPKYSGQTISQGKCEYTGVACYCDGSALRAEEWMKILVEEGSDKIWEMLEEEYKETFEENL